MALMQIGEYNVLVDAQWTVKNQKNLAIYLVSQIPK